MSTPYPLRVRYPDTFNVTTCSRGSCQGIRRFITYATLMFDVYYGAPTNPRLLTDPTTATALRDAYWALLEILSWMVSRPLREALELARDQGNITAEEAVQYLGELATFRTLIRTAGLKLGDDPFTSPSHIGPNVPAQTPAEIHYEILLLKYGPTTIDDAATLISERSGIPRRCGTWHYYNIGMPTTVVLCAGQDAANLPRVVALMDETGWHNGEFARWAAAARNSRLTSDYKENVIKLAKSVRRNTPGLETAFLGTGRGRNPTADADLDAAWRQVAHLEGLDPATYANLTVNALAFRYPSMQPRTRCRRCRTTYRFTVVGEPYSFGGVTTDYLSCAEVVAWVECRRIGLH